MGDGDEWGGGVVGVEIEKTVLEQFKKCEKKKDIRSHHHLILELERI